MGEKDREVLTLHYLEGLPYKTIAEKLGGNTGSWQKRSARAGVDGDSKIQRAPETVGVRIGRMIVAESSALNETMPLDKATDVLFAERMSPIRTREFLKNRIQMMSTEQLFQALMNAEVQTKKELLEVTRRLAKEDPEGTSDHLDAGDLRIYGMPNLYPVWDTLPQTWADEDAPAVLARLKKMKRGGSQQDSSLRFSGYWARINPEAVARFTKVSRLRAMRSGSHSTMPTA